MKRQIGFASLSLIENLDKTLTRSGRWSNANTSWIRALYL